MGVRLPPPGPKLALGVEERVRSGEGEVQGEALAAAEAAALRESVAEREGEWEGEGEGVSLRETRGEALPLAQGEEERVTSALGETVRESLKVCVPVASALSEGRGALGEAAPLTVRSLLLGVTEKVGDCDRLAERSALEVFEAEAVRVGVVEVVADPVPPAPSASSL